MADRTIAIKPSGNYTIPGDPPPDPDPFPPAVEAAERALEELGRDMMRRLGDVKEDRAACFDVIDILAALEEWIRAKDGRETKTCNKCGKATIPAFGLRWQRVVTYKCTCGGAELSVGESPDQPICPK